METDRDYLTDLWLGAFGLETLSFMIKDMCESVTFMRDLAQSEGEAADVSNDLAQIAAIVDYCERSYGAASTIEALGEAGADPEVILEAQAMMKAKA